MGACGGSQAALPTMPDPDDATVTLTAKIIKDDGTLDDMVMPVGAYVFTKDDPNTSQNETAIGVY